MTCVAPRLMRRAEADPAAVWIEPVDGGEVKYDGQRDRGRWTAIHPTFRWLGDVSTPSEALARLVLARSATSERDLDAIRQGRR